MSATKLDSNVAQLCSKRPCPKCQQDLYRGAYSEVSDFLGDYVVSQDPKKPLSVFSKRSGNNPRAGVKSVDVQLFELGDLKVQQNARNRFASLDKQRISPDLYGRMGAIVAGPTQTSRRTDPQVSRSHEF